MLPKISIITVVYNAKEPLEATLKNLSNLKYDNIELIIIDGGSKDGTLDVITKYSLYISTWISEPDKGLYDAMNKGLNIATGDYVWYINAGDLVHNETILNTIFMGQEQYSDVYYGETLIRNNEGEIIGLRKKRLPKRLKWQSFKRGMVVCHQSIIVKRSIAPLYDLQYRFAADIEWVMVSLKRAEKISNTFEILSEFIEGGISSNNRRESLIERFKIMKNHFGLLRTILYHILLLFNPRKYRSYNP